MRIIAEFQTQSYPISQTHSLPSSSLARKKGKQQTKRALNDFSRAHNSN